jgi:hypothetical protein
LLIDSLFIVAATAISAVPVYFPQRLQGPRLIVGEKYGKEI